MYKSAHNLKISNKIYNLTVSPRPEQGKTPYQQMVEKMQPEVIDMAKRNNPKLDLVGNIPIHAIHAVHSAFDALPPNIKEDFNNSGHKFALIDPSNPDKINKHIDDVGHPGYTAHIYNNILYTDPTIHHPGYQQSLINEAKRNNRWIQNNAAFFPELKRIVSGVHYGDPKAVHAGLFNMVSHELGHYMENRILDRYQKNLPFLGRFAKLAHIIPTVKMARAIEKEGIFSHDTKAAFNQGRYKEHQLPEENFAELNSAFMRNYMNNKHLNLPFEQHLDNFVKRLATKYPETAKVYHGMMKSALK